MSRLVKVSTDLVEFILLDSLFFCLILVDCLPLSLQDLDLCVGTFLLIDHSGYTSFGEGHPNSPELIEGLLNSLKGSGLKRKSISNVGAGERQTFLPMTGNNAIVNDIMLGQRFGQGMYHSISARNIYMYFHFSPGLDDHM